MHKIMIILIIGLVGCFISTNGWSNCNRLCQKRMIKKAARFFDFDKNKKLNPYEHGLFTTYQRMGWELATSPAKKKFDLNGDHMLDPTEWAHYKNRKKNEKNQTRLVDQRNKDTPKFKKKSLRK